MILGVDLSMNSTGLCVTDGKFYRFGASINLCSFSTKQETPSLEELYVTPKYDFLYRMSKLSDVRIFGHKRDTEKPKEHIGIGQRRLRDAASLPIIVSNNITSLISQGLAMGYEPMKIDHVGIEDYSMGSRTDNLIQVAEITSVLKTNHLTRLVDDISRFYTIPGPKIKVLAGGGNFLKDAMLNAFCNLTDPALVATPFHKFCIQNLSEITHLNAKKGRMDVLAPVSDIIDAFWICKYVQDIIIDGQKLMSAKDKEKLAKKKLKAK